MKLRSRITLSNVGTLRDRKNITQHINAFYHNVHCMCLFGMLKMAMKELWD